MTASSSLVLCSASLSYRSIFSLAAVAAVAAVISDGCCDVVVVGFGMPHRAAVAHQPMIAIAVIVVNVSRVHGTTTLASFGDRPW